MNCRATGRRAFSKVRRNDRRNHRGSAAQVFESKRPAWRRSIRGVAQVLFPGSIAPTRPLPWCNAVRAGRSQNVVGRAHGDATIYDKSDY
jgi:hypothetical protein